MKVLLCHTYYQQPGGEDQSFAAEARLLESRGHQVIRFERHNSELENMSRVRAAATTLWNRRIAAELKTLLRRERPDVMHCTNTFPLLSPSVYYAARREGLAVVQSLRNYRQLCPSALLMRNGEICEDCLTSLFAWRGVRHACYRDSRLASAVVAGMTSLHRLLGTWSSAVDQYFTLTEFARQKFIAAGWNADRIAVKPNFVDPDPGIGTGDGDYAVFVGRLSPEKGIDTLLAAWEQLPTAVPLKIIGQGPLENRVREFASRHAYVEVLGHRPLGEVLEILGRARFLVMPSIWYETFGRTIIEAYAKGTPVIASRLGAMAELVRDGETGLLFAPGNAADLADKVQRLSTRAEERQVLREAARQEYLRRYTAAPNYEQLIWIYRQALARSRRSPALSTAAAL
jgi:glycosyltransferase involved in cell wall biosynthesis